SLQLRATSKFGTPSATATTNCEFKTIIEKEIGISRLLRIAAKASGQRCSKPQRSLPQNRPGRDGNVLQAAAAGRQGRQGTPRAPAPAGTALRPHWRLPGGWPRTGTRYGARSRR